MKPFEYLAPSSLEEALTALKDVRPGVTVIAGGTDLIPRMRKGESQSASVLDLRFLPLKDIRKKRSACILERA